MSTLGNRHRINQLLLEEFGRSAGVTENHEILSRLPIFTFWTTNYDSLIEQSLERAGKIPDVKYTVPQLAVTRPRRDAIVYKMHGDAAHPDQAILTRDDYESYHIRMAPFITNLSGDLVSKTFLFLGFSFSDPNLDYILSRIRITYAQNQRRHYAMMRRVHAGDYDTPGDYDYAVVKQELFVKDLQRFNIKVLLVDSYPEITSILRQIERIYRSRSVFISGSAHEYGHWGVEESQRFIHGLSAELIRADYRVVSGFGLGVGEHVITGALSEIFMANRRTTGEQLVLQPFPQVVLAGTDRDALWQQYREDMISRAGIALFVFGNKKEAGGVALADGMRREFEIAVRLGLKVLPIGATGYMAEELWARVATDLGTFYAEHSTEIEPLLQQIGDKANSPTDTIGHALRAVKMIAGL